MSRLVDTTDLKAVELPNPFDDAYEQLIGDLTGNPFHDDEDGDPWHIWFARTQALVTRMRVEYACDPRRRIRVLYHMIHLGYFSNQGTAELTDAQREHLSEWRAYVVVTVSGDVEATALAIYCLLIAIHTGGAWGEWYQAFFEVLLDAYPGNLQRFLSAQIRADWALHGSRFGWVTASSEICNGWGDVTISAYHNVPLQNQLNGWIIDMQRRRELEAGFVQGTLDELNVLPNDLTRLIVAHMPGAPTTFRSRSGSDTHATKKQRTQD